MCSMTDRKWGKALKVFVAQMCCKYTNQSVPSWKRFLFMTWWIKQMLLCQKRQPSSQLPTRNQINDSAVQRGTAVIVLIIIMVTLSRAPGGTRADQLFKWATFLGGKEEGRVIRRLSEWQTEGWARGARWQQQEPLSDKHNYMKTDTRRRRRRPQRGAERTDFNQQKGAAAFRGSNLSYMYLHNICS